MSFSKLFRLRIGTGSWEPGGEPDGTRGGGVGDRAARGGIGDRAARGGIGLCSWEKSRSCFVTQVQTTSPFVRFRALSARHTPTSPEKACVGGALHTIRSHADVSRRSEVKVGHQTLTSNTQDLSMIVSVRRLGSAGRALSREGVT